MTLADRATFIKDLIFSMQVSFPNLSFSFIFRHGEEGRLLALGPLVAGVAPRRKAMTLPSAIRHWLSLANTAAKHHTASTARAAETPRFFTSKVELKKHAARCNPPQHTENASVQPVRLQRHHIHPGPVYAAGFTTVRGALRRLNTLPLF